jgi:Fe-S cluster assembly protein SufD
VSPVVEEKDVFRAQFERFAESLSRSDGWLRPVRTAAIAHFAERGFPTTKDEAWRSTSVAAIARTVFARPKMFSATRSELDAAGHIALGGAELVFVNGRLLPELSNRGGVAGVTVASLAEALATGAERLAPHLTRIVSHEKSAFTALNTAFVQDGAIVEITGVVKRPIELVFYSSPDGEATVTYPRVLVLARASSEATLVESYLGRGCYLTSAVSEIVLEANARLEHVKLQRESESAFHVGALGAHQGRASRFVSRHFALGAALARSDIETRFDGEGGECQLDGLLLAGGAQHSDTHTLIDHAQPRCSSRELYKGIVDGRGHGVFHGRIVVRKDAQQTDAQQTNKNLLLSREALVQSTPQLEILADDVKCKHASTTGQLEEAALFYLRSRGIGEPEARALLTWAFASDVVQRLRLEPLRRALQAQLGARLTGALEVPA